jgi:uncharacterized Zn finger protein (UPF0148 family)
MYYCKQCDHYMEIPAWDGNTVVCPECGTIVWGEEDEREASKTSTEGMRTLDETLEERLRKGKVSHRKTRKGLMEGYCWPW